MWRCCHCNIIYPHDLFRNVCLKLPFKCLYLLCTHPHIFSRIYIHSFFISKGTVEAIYMALKIFPFVSRSSANCNCYFAIHIYHTNTGFYGFQPLEWMCRSFKNILTVFNLFCKLWSLFCHIDTILTLVSLHSQLSFWASIYISLESVL